MHNVITGKISFFNAASNTINKGRLAFLFRFVPTAKKLVGVAVHIATGGCGEADADSVKMREDGTINAEDSAVRLVRDNDIKITAGERRELGIKSLKRGDYYF